MYKIKNRAKNDIFIELPDNKSKCCVAGDVTELNREEFNSHSCQVRLKNEQFVLVDQSDDD